MENNNQTTEDKQSVPNQKPQQQQTIGSRTADELFDEVDNPQKSVEPTVKKEEDKSSNHKEKEPAPNKPISEKKGLEETKEEDSETSKLKAELEKSKKIINDNVTNFRTKSKNMKQALQKTKEFVEEGELSEEHANTLIKLLEGNNSSEEEIEDLYENSNHPFAKFMKVTDKELENLRKYSDDSTIDAKIEAFGFFVATASKEELDTAIEELEDLYSDPIKLTRRMLSMGESYNNGIYKEVKEAGGIVPLLKNKDKEIEKLKNKVDRLNKNIADSEYDIPVENLDSEGQEYVPSAVPSVGSSMADSIFSK